MDTFVCHRGTHTVSVNLLLQISSSMLNILIEILVPQNSPEWWFIAPSIHGPVIPAGNRIHINCCTFQLAVSQCYRISVDAWQQELQCVCLCVSVSVCELRDRQLLLLQLPESSAMGAVYAFPQQWMRERVDVIKLLMTSGLYAHLCMCKGVGGGN